MATAKRKSRRKLPLWLKLAVLAALALLAAGWHFGGPVLGRAQLAAAYGARVACSCHHLGGRALDQCKADFEPGMELVMLSQNVEAGSVTASIPLLARSTATYRDGYGCVLERWAG